MRIYGWRREKPGAGEEAVIEILIADDHRLLRQGLRQIMAEEPDMEITGETGSIAGLMYMLRQREWDALLLDISLPDRSGLDALKDIKEMCPEMPVLMLSMHSEARYARQALEKGASGYVTKSSAAEEVAEAVRRVVAGDIYVSEAIARELQEGDGSGLRS